MSIIPSPFSRRLFLGAALGAVAVATLPSAQASEVTYQSGGTAINGYDPVAYFTMSKPVEGNSAHTIDWNGATWQFSSAENLATFSANPEKYAPKYGGYCAYAVSRGYTASTDPAAWSIVDGSLYLNYSKGVRSRWNSEQAENIIAGDKNWPGIRAKL